MYLFSALAFFSLVSCAPTVVQRDVFSPPVLYPRQGTVWKIGQRHNVTWDLSNAPAHVTNSIGMIVLVKNHRMIDLENPLAQNFSIFEGHHEIVVPHHITPGHDYQILVFGDSGNTGPMFTITK